MIGTPFSTFTRGDYWNLNWSKNFEWSLSYFEGETSNRSFTFIVQTIWYKLFGENPFYILEGITLSIAVIFLFKLGKELFNKNVAIIASVCFLLAVPYKFGLYGIMWLANYTSVISTMALIMALYYGIKYLKYSTKKFFILGILSAILSYTTKEVNVVLPLFLLYI